MEKTFYINGDTQDIEAEYDVFSQDIRHQSFFFSHRSWQIDYVKRKAGEKYTHIVKHWHEEMEWIVPVQGNAECWLKGQRHVVHPGELIVIPSFVVHESRRENFHEPYEGYVVHVSDDYLRALVSGYDKLDYAPMADDRQEVYQCMQEIISFLQGEDPLAKLKIQCKIDQILLLLTEKAKERNEVVASKHDLVLSALQELNERAYASCHLQDIADRLHVSYAHLSRVFKNATGISMTEYVGDLRMNKAREEIENTDLPLEEIGQRCGYSNYSAFAKKFRQRFNETPSSLRKSYSQHF